MSLDGDGRYAYVIDTRDSTGISWHPLAGDGKRLAAGVAAASVGGPREFAGAALRACLDGLPADVAEYYLYDDEDTTWRIRVWDTSAADCAGHNPVPLPGGPGHRAYPLALAAAGIEPHSTLTMPGPLARSRLRARPDVTYPPSRAGRPSA